MQRKRASGSLLARPRACFLTQLRVVGVYTSGFTITRPKLTQGAAWSSTLISTNAAASACCASPPLPLRARNTAPGAGGGEGREMEGGLAGCVQ